MGCGLWCGEAAVPPTSSTHPGTPEDEQAARLAHHRGHQLRGGRRLRRRRRHHHRRLGLRVGHCTAARARTCRCCCVRGSCCLCWCWWWWWCYHIMVCSCCCCCCRRCRHRLAGLPDKADDRGGPQGEDGNGRKVQRTIFMGKDAFTRFIGVDQHVVGRQAAKQTAAAAAASVAERCDAGQQGVEPAGELRFDEPSLVDQPAQVLQAASCARRRARCGISEAAQAWPALRGRRRRDERRRTHPTPTSIAACCWSRG